MLITYLFVLITVSVHDDKASMKISLRTPGIKVGLSETRLVYFYHVREWSINYAYKEVVEVAFGIHRGFLDHSTSFNGLIQHQEAIIVG